VNKSCAMARTRCALVFSDERIATSHLNPPK
jgi:hypothetical protein